jgi:hypothetical protein
VPKKSLFTFMSNKKIAQQLPFFKYSAQQSIHKKRNLLCPIGKNTIATSGGQQSFTAYP